MVCHFQGCEVLGSEPCDGVVLLGNQVRRRTVPARDLPVLGRVDAATASARRRRVLQPILVSALQSESHRVRHGRPEDPRRPGTTGDLATDGTRESDRPCSSRQPRSPQASADRRSAQPSDVRLRLPLVARQTASGASARPTRAQYHLPRAKPPKATRPMMAMITPSKMLQTSATTIPTITRMPPVVMPPILRSAMNVLP